MAERDLTPVGELLSRYYCSLEAKHGPLTADRRYWLARTLVACEHLGQLRMLPGGFSAWLRADYSHLELLFSRELDAVMALGTRELTTGNVCFVAEVFASTPGEAYREMRRLQHLPGVEWMAAWRNINRRKVQRVNRHGREFPTAGTAAAPTA